MVLWGGLWLEAILTLLKAIMSSITEVTYNYFYSLFEYFRRTWPLSLVYGPLLQSPSPSTTRTVREAIHLLKQSDAEGSNVITTRYTRSSVSRTDSKSSNRRTESRNSAIGTDGRNSNCAGEHSRNSLGGNDMQDSITVTDGSLNNLAESRSLVTQTDSRNTVDETDFRSPESRNCFSTADSSSESISSSCTTDSRNSVDSTDSRNPGNKSESKNSTTLRNSRYSTNRTDSTNSTSVTAPQPFGQDSVMKLLDAVPTQEDILRVVDTENCYDIFQHAVLTGRKDVVLRLLHRGCSPDRYHCTPPHHLAAYLGKTTILNLLLAHGANPAHKKGVCFPEPHLPVGCKVSYFGFTQHQVYLCHDHFMTPMQCAIQQRQIDCVKLLTDTLTRWHDKRTPNFTPINHLQYACKEGAAECIRYFVSQFPECINEYGADGDTPLLTAVPWGEECVKILVDSGADVHLLSRGIGETALHRLYRMNIDGLFSIYDTTRYLLTTGIEQDINAVTDLGETPLHMLVSHVSYAGGNYVDPSRHHLSRAGLQGDYQSQVVMAVRALLEFNADPLMLNGPGLQPLSRMLHIALKACHRDDPCPCVRTSQPDMFIVEYKNDYATLTEAIQILLDHGAPADFTCAVGHTPLILLMQCLLHDDVRSLAAQSESALNAVEALILGGAEVNFTDGGHNTAATLVAMVCRRCLTEPDIRSDPALQAEYADFTVDLLMLFLSHGLDPNHTTTRSSPFLRGGSGNALIEFVRLAELARTSADFQLVRRWLCTLFQWGADPDIEPYQSEPIICHSQSSIFLKKQGTQPISHYLHDARERQNSPSALTPEVCEGTQELLSLFYNSMDHKTLFDCLHAARGVTRLHLQESLAVGAMPKDDFLSTLHWMSESPRSLKQIARVAVYKALDRRVAERVEGLPIPWAVKQYLLECS